MDIFAVAYAVLCNSAMLHNERNDITFIVIIIIIISSSSMCVFIVHSKRYKSYMHGRAQQSLKMLTISCQFEETSFHISTD